MGAPKERSDLVLIEGLERMGMYEEAYRFAMLKREVKSLKISNAALKRRIAKNDW